jgi:hypothetical protein
MIMAEGVKSSPKDPKGPDRESSKYISSPATTGGNPMSALISVITLPRHCQKRPHRQADQRCQHQGGKAHAQGQRHNGQYRRIQG